jgi:hypothetical protein
VEEVPKYLLDLMALLPITAYGYLIVTLLLDFLIRRFLRQIHAWELATGNQDCVQEIRQVGSR